ncbi:MAG: GxxExxY protein [Acidobacteria bacterium]|nr:GxxExxY protein [Acidobacteriota bacterium]MCL5287537.1 GxxExxY protein [Acidobacteriota bacterium]
MEPQINADERRSRLVGITQKTIGCAFEVANKLGCGFLEKVYENALAHEIRKQGLAVQQQFPVAVSYDGVVVGDYVADLLVAGCVLVELKAVKDFDEIHAAQCMNYLKATGLKVCLLINFGKPRVDIKRLVNKY